MAATAQTITAAFRARAAAHPQKTALWYLGCRTTYGQLNRWVDAFASALATAGVAAGDRVLIYLPNCPQWAVAWLGTLARGAVAVPIAPIYTSRDLAYIASDTGAKTVVCADTNYGYVVQAAAETDIARIVHTNLADLVPPWKRAFGHLYDRIPSGTVARDPRSVPLRRFLRQGRGEPPPAPAADDLAEILYTGGTTRHPKGVPISHRLFLASAEPQLRVSDPLVLPGENVILQGAPLFHILGQVFGLGGLCLGGDTLILLPKVNTDALMDQIGRHRARSLFAVPALFRMLLEHDRLDQYDLSSLVYCFSGGDVLPNEVARRWHERFGVPIYPGYGATETVGGVTLTPTDRASPVGAMGQVLPHKRVRIVDLATLEEVPAGAPGELLVGSDPMVDAYWNKPEETREAFVTLDGLPWYRTGDIVSADAEGFVSFVDRTVDTIKHKGYRVAASEVEAVLQDHSAVVAACVVGVADEEVGERIKAFVVLKNDVKGISG
ncbi:MAG TPA: AMP-binding protein, partial [Deferrisomatales bacterium]|nr:AMP-binding protein [Deferrisomatales bacterium]